MELLNRKYKDILENEFNKLVKEHYKIPSLLYHYTDGNGLIDILNSKSIWATDYRYLMILQKLDME